MVLTVGGVFLAALLFLIASVFVHSYTESLYTEAEMFPENSIMITGNLSEDIYTDVQLNYGSVNYNIYYSPITTNGGTYNWNNKKFSLIPTVIGTGSGFTGTAVPTLMVENNAYETKIVAGRAISAEDIANKQKVVVISQLAADILFGGDGAVGKMIEIPFGEEYMAKEQFLVIGIYQNSIDEETVYKNIDATLKKDIVDFNVIVNYYIPYTVLEDYKQYFSAPLQTIMIDVDGNNHLKSAIENRYKDVENLEVYYREKKIKDIDEINEDLLMAAHLVMIVMMLIAGLNLFNSMMFSIRERISEIGIRKAIGADDRDIWNQFVFEGIIVSIIGVILAIIITVIGVVIVQIALDYFTVLDIHIVLNAGMLAEAFCFCILLGAVSSIIPAFIASKTNIIDAIRFD